jgi:ATP-binding cassette subfamily B protein
MPLDFFLRKAFHKKVPVYIQSNIMDCGPTCLQMVSSHYGRYYSIETLRSYADLSNTGVNLLGLRKAAEKIGFNAKGIKLTYGQLISEVTAPVILFWNQKHFVIFLKKKPGKKNNINVIDPAQGSIWISEKEFISHWSNTVDDDGEPIGFALTLTTENQFYTQSGEKKSIFSWNLVVRYFANDYSQLFYILLTILFSTVCQVLIPYLTKNLVDVGIKSKNLSFVSIIILAQLAVLFGKMISDFIRAKFLLTISNFINRNMASDFWKKLMRLPLSFFEIRRGGDIFQRLSDNKQIQSFLTGPAVNSTFSFITCITFSYILYSYNKTFFLIFLAGAIIYYCWIRFFFDIKRKLNHTSNALATMQNDLSLQFVQGMGEIRIGNGEEIMLKEWEKVQNMIFELNEKTLRYSQIQYTGGLVINQGKDLIIIFMATVLVINQNLTLGTLIAIQYIIGSLSSPIEQLISFSQNVLEAKQSINRLNDVYVLKDENKGQVDAFDINQPIVIENLTFSYPGAGNTPVLKSLNLTIPQGKVTAIVGLSGSGKTTLLKLILRFYENYEGKIMLGTEDLRSLNNKKWREHCGAVLQDGYIFNNTIERNIVIGSEDVNHDRLLEACDSANILNFINTLPNGFGTSLGVGGVNLSQGQKQRVLIARAIYKCPALLLFDEATNSLDAENEKIIVGNLEKIFSDKTVIIIAHRLSTVKDAQNIVVLDNGEIIEEGTHKELVAKNGKYLQLVKNQLELGI